VAEAIATGDPAPVKILLQSLIHGIRVDGRGAIHPIFQVPVGVLWRRCGSRTVPVGGR
jgi:hypothetical protein